MPTRHDPKANRPAPCVWPSGCLSSARTRARPARRGRSQPRADNGTATRAAHRAERPRSALVMREADLDVARGRTREARERLSGLRRPRRDRGLVLAEFETRLMMLQDRSERRGGRAIGPTRALLKGRRHDRQGQSSRVQAVAGPTPVLACRANALRRRVGSRACNSAVVCRWPKIVQWWTIRRAGQVTQLLEPWRQGDRPRRGSIPLVYAQLRSIAALRAARRTPRPHPAGHRARPRSLAAAHAAARRALA